MVRVLSYNIQDGGDDRLSAIQHVIRGQQPHLAALLEANSRANAEVLAGDARMDLVYGEANSEAAVAWMSRLPIERGENHRLAALAKTLLEIEVTWDGGPLHLFATHLTAGRKEQDGHRRAEEVRSILPVLRRVAGRPHLLVGDFNALHPDDPAGEPPPGVEQGYLARRPIQLLLEAGYVDCYRTLHPDAPGYTYLSSHPWLRLDYIFASPEIAARLHACDMVTGTEATRASDHFPVWAEFR
jgi:exodeoxyribonuclease-3